MPLIEEHRMRTFKRKDCLFTRERNAGLVPGAWPIAAGALAMLFWAGLALPARGGPPADDVPDFAVRVRVIKADGAAPAADDVFTVGLARSVPLELQKDEFDAIMEETEPTRGGQRAFKGAEWSPWVESTRENILAELAEGHNSRNSLWQFTTLCFVERTGKAAGRLDLEVETRVSNGRVIRRPGVSGESEVNFVALQANGETNRTPAELHGPKVGVILWRGADGAVHIDTFAGHGRRVYDAAMRNALLPPADRPKRILFGDRYENYDDDAVCWREGIQRLAGLGFNAMHGVPAAFTPAVREAGVNRIWGAVYCPPGYAFDFATNRHEVLRAFVANQIQPALDAGWKREEFAFWVTSDEPGWYYPARYRQLNDDPAAMKEFHAHLHERGLTPRDLGRADWNEVRLIGRREYSDLPSRRLFYWSNRFVPWASSRYFSEVTRAYETELGTGFPVLVNWNNFIGTFYEAGLTGHNRDAGDPNVASGFHDWLEFGRLRGATCVSTEDWFGDDWASQWSYYATRIRSAGELSGVGFGGLVIPRESGQQPEGMAQKILALVGQGAKTIEFFTFGPEYYFPGNCYSEHPAAFKPLALGMGIVGRAEELLYPGRMRKPETAILMPQSAQLWDFDGQDVPPGALMDETNAYMYHRHMAYMSETYGIYQALQHMAIPVQAIDEEACANGELAPYKVIYLTAPDLPEEAAEGLLRWAQAGGTLVMTAGSGLLDRYHQPMRLLGSAAGVEPDRAVRPGGGPNNGMLEGPAVRMGTNTAPSFGDRERLTLKGADVRATFADGAPLLTEKAVKRGCILRFACFPGSNYGRSGMKGTLFVESAMTAAWRELIVEPVRKGGVTLPVIVDRPRIEAPALYSDRGVAVTLLNWTGVAQSNVTVVVRSEREPARVVSARRGPLQANIKAVQNGPFAFEAATTVDLDGVDVLSVYWR